MLLIVMELVLEVAKEATILTAGVVIIVQDAEDAREDARVVQEIVLDVLVIAEAHVLEIVTAVVV